jgi:hypothetical protein
MGAVLISTHYQLILTNSRSFPLTNECPRAVPTKNRAECGRNESRTSHTLQRDTMQAVGGQTRARAARPENGIASSQPDAALRCRSYEHPAHAQVTGRTHAAAGNCETFAARTDAGVVSSRSDTALSGRSTHTPAHGKASCLERRMSGGWLCIGLHRARRWAAMHKMQLRPFRHAIREAHIATRCADPSTSARAATRKSPPCWQTSALPSAGPCDTAAAIQRTQREASTPTVARAHVAATGIVTTQPPAAWPRSHRQRDHGPHPHQRNPTHSPEPFQSVA